MGDQQSLLCSFQVVDVYISGRVSIVEVVSRLNEIGNHFFFSLFAFLTSLPSFIHAVLPYLCDQAGEYCGAGMDFIVD